ncbi:MAG: hypothetical protein HOA60_13545 [Rhodospirillales bacterium]|nr:hypothetical protein [Rhodospirillales bacterium]
MAENDDNTTLDPAAVLRAAIEAARKPSVAPTKESPKTAENSGIESNVHAHPALLREARPAATQGYFVTEEPMVRRCDPAFGAGLEFT